MNKINVHHRKENNRIYDLTMNELPTYPEDYFNDIIINGNDGWVWAGPGTAIRGKEFCQVAD